MPIYFAYGSNMDRDAMNARCPSSDPLGIGSLADHRFVVTHDGYASVSSEPGSVVYGLVWRLDPRDEASLDSYEELENGLYRKAFVVVRSKDLDQEALIYIGRNPGQGSPKSGYMESVLAAANANALPDAYRDELRRWLPPPVRNRRHR